MRALFGAGEFLAFLLGKIAADGGVPRWKRKENETNERKRNGQWANQNQVASCHPIYCCLSLSFRTCPTRSLALAKDTSSSFPVAASSLRNRPPSCWTSETMRLVMTIFSLFLLAVAYAWQCRAMISRYRRLPGQREWPRPSKQSCGCPPWCLWRLLRESQRSGGGLALELLEDAVAIPLWFFLAAAAVRRLVGFMVIIVDSCCNTLANHLLMMDGL